MVSNEVICISTRYLCCQLESKAKLTQHKCLCSNSLWLLCLFSIWRCDLRWRFMILLKEASHVSVIAVQGHWGSMTVPDHGDPHLCLPDLQAHCQVKNPSLRRWGHWGWASVSILVMQSIQLWRLSEQSVICLLRMEEWQKKSVMWSSGKCSMMFC